MLRWLRKFSRIGRAGLEAIGKREEERLAESMRTAYRLHESGELEQAERTYRSILLERPQDADAQYLLGEIANRTGRHREAAALLAGAIDANPGVAEIHYELGRAMRALGEPARAVTCFRSAIEIDRTHLDAHIDLASAILSLGNVEAAERAARDALSMAPRSVPARINLGAALEGQGKFSDAADSYRAILAIDSDCVPALANLSAVCLRLGAIEEAQSNIEHALRIEPDNPEVHIRRGDVLLEQRLPERAADSLREALRLKPDLTAAYNGLGFTYDIQGRFESAMINYEKALELDPDHFRAHVNRAAVWLLQEDFARGWDEYEWRLRSPEHAPVHERFRHPRWDGSSLAGRRILVYAEQGLGDEIMFASCLPEIIAQAAHCVLDCEPRLAGLFRRSFPQSTVHGGRQTEAVDWLEGAGRIDLAIPAGSLPLYLRRTAAAFPRHAGYLIADAGRVKSWSERLQTLGPGMKIGLSWRGGVPQTGRGSRSIGLAELLPILRREGVHFVSLQYGPTDEELGALQRQHGIAIHHWQEAIGDYEETAALVSALDLTLSVCTAVVDLAGALGRPAWVLAPVRSDFRYGLEGAGMRWYPSVRMFRQSVYGNWQPVIAAVEAALSELPR